ncbi:MAG: hypothetical protein IRZ33_11905, partial [Alicyclobacillaceae bacterium]|nr:hypothetical protein [Alicyclobacillaceae bacterium]
MNEANTLAPYAMRAVDGTLLHVGQHVRVRVRPRRWETIFGCWTAAWRSLRFTFTLPVTWALFDIYTLLMMARQMVTSYLPIAIERLLPWHFGSSTVSIGMLMGLSAVVGAVITVLAGHAGDRTGYIRVLALAFGVLVPATVTLGWARHLALFTTALTVFSAGN